MASLVPCLDVGSTWTKGLLVDLDSWAPARVEPWGEGVSRLTLPGLVATAQHPTTLAGDVMTGVDRVLGSLAETVGSVPGRLAAPLVCSSAGGGLRLAVVGYERVVTAEAGRRAGLSAGARVVHVAAGRLDAADLTALRVARPDILLLTGGTDGGDRTVLGHNAATLADARLGLPVVVAGNREAAAAAGERLAADPAATVTVTANVLPRIGELDPGPARAAVRAAFLRHVIGGDRLSQDRGFDRLVLAATPDVVLAGVEQLAVGHPRGVLAVDVGGATTDVYSVVSPAALAAVDADVAGSAVAGRTVEGDLGMRWSAPGVVAAAAAERLAAAEEPVVTEETAAALAADPGALDQDPVARAVDTALARLAAVVAVRRHARPAVPGGAARPLRDAALAVGSGGVLRHGGAARAREVLAAVLADHAGRWHVPDDAVPVVDTGYALCALGLLALAPADVR